MQEAHSPRKMKVTGLVSSAFFCSTALAIGQKPTINFNGTGIRLAEGGSSVQLYADNGDWPGVLRVVDDLAEDFGRVTGTKGTVTLLGKETSPSLNASATFNVTGKTGFGTSGPGRYDRRGGAIIAGTIGNSTIIDRLISEGKVDVSEVEGNWEAYVSTVVDNPVQGVSRAVVIAGKKVPFRLSTRAGSLTASQAPTREVPSTACIPSPNRLAFHLGTSGPIHLLRSTVRSMLKPSRLCKSHLQSSTVVSS